MLGYLCFIYMLSQSIFSYGKRQQWNSSGRSKEATKQMKASEEINGQKNKPRHVILTSRDEISYIQILRLGF